MNDIYILVEQTTSLSERRFWTGYGWSREYPDAKKFKTYQSAKAYYSKADLVYGFGTNVKIQQESDYD